MRLVALIAAGIVAAAAVVVWRSRHGAEVWHTVADAPT
jgi:hypothetical protein